MINLSPVRNVGPECSKTESNNSRLSSLELNDTPPVSSSAILLFIYLNDNKRRNDKWGFDYLQSYGEN